MKATVIVCAALCGRLYAQTGDITSINETFINGWMAGAAAGRVVGKPYSATVISHSVQTLANGSHISNITQMLVWQDGEGRLRQEWPGRHQVAIDDPVAGFRYVLDTEKKSGRKIQMRLGAQVIGNGNVARVAPPRLAGLVSALQEARQAASRMPNAVVDDLGTQYISGVAAEGVRTTVTMPIGAVGNDEELRSVTERWYSNEIHALVKTVTNDPRTGNYTYELSNIVRTAPDPALFQPPPGYTITDNANQWRSTSNKEQ